MNTRHILLAVSITCAFQACDRPLLQGEWQVVAGGFSFPEGPAWDGDGSLYVSNCYGDWLACLRNGVIDTVAHASDSTFNRTNGLFVDTDGIIYACDYAAGAIRSLSPDGCVRTLVAGYAGRPFSRPNDLIVFGDQLYFTDPAGYGVDKLAGRLFRYNLSSCELVLAADRLAYPNGLALSPRDDRLYVCESARNRIISFSWSDAGDLADPVEFVHLPGGDPDGIEFDRAGNLYVAHFGGGAVYVIAPDGTILQKIVTPGRKPSNLEFGGNDGQTLFLTEVETNTVYQIRTRIAGARTKLGK
ncbi:MAG: SMP-30/gluconolactonase/LRE family protein [Candidatus Neomarinimicrobiota bacterium]